MSLRRHVNLVSLNGYQGIYSLRCLNSDNFFYPANEAAAKARDLSRLRRVPPASDAFYSWMVQKEKKKKPAAALSGQQHQLESIIRPPRPIFSVRPTTCPTTYSYGDRLRLHSFPLSGTKILFADSAKRTTLYDTEARCAISTPCLHERKDYPVALSVPSPAGPEAEAEGEQDQYGGSSSSLYILDTRVDPRNATPFEALIWRGREHRFFTAPKTWHCDALPRPPFFDHDHGRNVEKAVDEMNRPAARPVNVLSCAIKDVVSYAVVGDVICVSVPGLGTYCFDTVSRTWSLAGDWMMPFSGKAEYVPELKLWFGVSADNQQLPCAADLSPVPGGHAPKKQHRYVWGDPQLPADWLPDMLHPASIVSLGSGRFCIVNYFRDMKDCCTSCMGVSDYDGYPIVVFSGLEVLAANGNDDRDSCKDSGKGNGNGLRMIKHKSRLFSESDTSHIQAVI